MSERLKQLAEDLALASNTRLLPENNKFRRGDRVVVHADPHQFKEMQTERYGGWNDDMALVCYLHLSLYYHPKLDHMYHTYYIFGIIRTYFNV